MQKLKHNLRNIIKLGVFLTLSIFAFLSYTYFTQAQIPDFVNYQGRLRDTAGAPITAATTIQFSLYNHLTNGGPGDVPGVAGALLWTETYDGAGGCTQITPGDDGIFAQHLGDCVSFPDYLDFTQEYYLGVKIGADAEASPRVPLSTHPYAFTSKRLNVRDENIYITSENSGDIILQAADDILLHDTNDEVGTNGQLLSSTGTGIDWIDASSLSAGSLWDTDHDTGIQVEEGVDDDTIRFDTLNTQRMAIDNAGNIIFSDIEPASFINPGAMQGLLFRDDKFALRVGEVQNTEWDDANVGRGTFASGRNNIVSGNYSTALGGNNNINDVYATALGRNHTVTGSYSVAGGFQNTAGGYASTVFGQTNQATDRRAMAWGLDNTASQDETTAWGRNTNASANYATSWGRDTVASGELSTAFGYQNTASQQYGTAFGYRNTASGRYATVWGGQNTASGQYSTAWGSHNTASGAHSTAIGFYSTASAENGTAIGDSLANSNYMTAIGRFNENVAGEDLTNWVDTDQLFVIGNGSGWQDANRSNALTILKNGTITAPTFSLAEINTAGNTALVTKEYVDDAITAGNVNIYNADRQIVGGDRTVDLNGNYLNFQNTNLLVEIGENEIIHSVNNGSNLSSEMSQEGGGFNFASANTTTGERLFVSFEDADLQFYVSGDNNATGTRLTIGTGSLPIESSVLGFSGAVYGADYSANYTNRSLVDKEYVDNASANASLWNRNAGTGSVFPKNLTDKVGIGTNDPRRLLHLYNSAPYLAFTETDQGVDARNWQLGGFNGFLFFGNRVDDWSSGSDVLAMDRSGKVGIGRDIFTETISSVLHVDSNDINTNAIFTMENTAGDMQMFRTDATPESTVTGSIGDLAFDSTNGEAYIKNTGDDTNTGWLRMLRAGDAFGIIDQDGDTWIRTETSPGTDEDIIVAQSANTGLDSMMEWKTGTGVLAEKLDGNMDHYFYNDAEHYTHINGNNIHLEGDGAVGNRIYGDLGQSFIQMPVGNGSAYFTLNPATAGSHSEFGEILRLAGTDVDKGWRFSNTQLKMNRFDRPILTHPGTVWDGNLDLGFSDWTYSAGQSFNIRILAPKARNGNVIYSGRSITLQAGEGNAQGSEPGDVLMNADWGNVGIGSIDPSTKLHIDSNDVNTNAIFTMENTAGDMQMFRTDATPESTVAGSIGDLAFDSTNGEAYIKNTGDDTNTGWLRMLRMGDLASLWDTNGDTGIQVEESANEDMIRFDTAGNERLIIDNNGNIGIKTTNPAVDFEIQSDSDDESDTFVINDSAGNNNFSVRDSGVIELGDGQHINNRTLFRARGNGLQQDVKIVQGVTTDIVRLQIGNTFELVRNGGAPSLINSPTLGIEVRSPYFRLNSSVDGGSILSMDNSSGGVAEIQTGQTSGASLLRFSNSHNLVNTVQFKDSIIAISDATEFVPIERLEIEGALRIASATGSGAGTIQWDGTNFQGHDGTNWINLDTTTFTGLTDTPAGYTAGSILFTSSTAVTQDNNNFFWDDTNNRLGIGTSTPSAQLHTTGPVRFQNFGAGTMQTDANGNVSVSSDERLKNIQGVFDRGLAELLEINPIEYKWKKETGYDTENSYYGFSAQNVKLSIPEAVGKDGRGYLTLSDRPLLATAINAIKELNQKQEEQKVTITSNTLKTDQSITTLTELQTSVDSNLAIINTSLTNLGKETKDNKENIKDNKKDLTELSENINSLTELTTTLTDTVANHEERIAQIEVILEEGGIELNTSNSVELPEVLTIFADNLETLEKDSKIVGFTLEGKLVVEEIEVGEITISNNDKNPVVGTAIIKEGETEVKIKTTKVKETSHILLTPRNMVNTALGEIEEREYFTIRIAEPIETDIKVEWFIIQEK